MTEFLLPPALRGLRWLRVAFTLRNQRVVPSQHAHPLSVFDAILRAPNKTLGRPGVFHVRTTPSHRLRIAEGASFELEAMLPTGGAAEGERWLAALRAELETPSRNFTLTGTPRIEVREAQAWTSAIPAEVCLEFMTPFAFQPGAKAAPGRPQGAKPLPTALDAAEFADQLRQRLSKFFGVALDCQALMEGVQVLPYFWQFANIPHQSRSQPGEVKLIKGCAGPLYLRGNLGPLLPVLALCAEVHAGGAMAFGQGYFRLHSAPRPVFPAGFPSAQVLAAATQRLLDVSDSALADASARFGQPFDPQAFAEAIAEDLRAGRYVPKPATVHRIPKHDGSLREIEELDLMDRVVHGALHSALAPVFDVMFEPASLGYRKGKSLDTVREAVGGALQEGFRFALESDIEDFFPSVDHTRLREALARVLPLADAPIIDLVLSVIRVPRMTDAGSVPRTHGLPQGSPLSPLLANLFLDSFDEAFAGDDVRLVRYADDFVILTRRREDAEAAEREAQRLLALLGLHLKPAKTAIIDAHEGFQFIGIRFGGDGADAAPPADHRRPLYVVESGCFVGVNGEALEVRAHGMLKQVFPLRRISVLVLLNRAVLSSALIAKCTALDVPITLTLESGYHLATWAPDRRHFFATAFRQAAFYNSLSDTARLAIARDIVIRKVDNALAFLRQRYSVGDAEWAQTMRDHAANANVAESFAALRGVEGYAARLYFERYAAEISDPFFRFVKRNRDAPDAINSLLNFGYYLLFARINATLRALGLNPYLGFLHESGERFETLVCDVQEVFRAHVDRLILRLLGQKAIRPEHFAAGPRGTRLTGEGVRAYVAQFEQEMARSPKTGGLSLSAAIYAQCLNLRYYLCDEGHLNLYRFGE